MNDKPIVVYTDHETNRMLSYHFAKGSNSLMCHASNFIDFESTIVTYGYRRGTGDLIRKVKNFYYIDHGYFKQSKRKFIKNKVHRIDFNGYFRITYNNFWHDGSGNKPSDRFNKLGIEIKDKKKSGEYIILSEPTPEAMDYYDLYNWTKETTKKIKLISDRKIITHNRNSKIPLKNLLQNAWAFVSDHSSAGFMSMFEGVPAYFTNETLKSIAPIKNIENHQINYSVFNNLAYEQWNIKEIESGEAWEYLKNKI